MKAFKGKVAVITGAASGIGRALADRCAQEGMKAVLADVDSETLAKTEASLKASGATGLARTDRCFPGQRCRSLETSDLDLLSAR